MSISERLFRLHLSRILNLSQRSVSMAHEIHSSVGVSRQVLPTHLRNAKEWVRSRNAPKERNAPNIRWPCSYRVFNSAHKRICRFGQTSTLQPFHSQEWSISNSPCSLLHHTVWRTWLFIAYSDKRWLYYQFSLPHLVHFLFLNLLKKVQENVLFTLGSETAKPKARSCTFSWTVHVFPRLSTL